MEIETLEKPEPALDYLRRRWRHTTGLAGLAFLATLFGWMSVLALPVLPLPPVVRYPVFLLSTTGGMLAPFALLLGLGYGPFLLVCAPFSREARLEVIPGVAIGLATVLGFITIGPLSQVRHEGLLSIAEQARPLISALEDYKAEHGAYPQSLEALVPTHLPSIPRTGAVLYPEFGYTLRPGEESYELQVPTPIGILNFDFFFYWPEGNYPESIWGNNSLERINDWAYVHE